MRLSYFKLILITCLSLSVWACKARTQQPYDREEVLFRYFREIQGLPFEPQDTNMYSIVIFQSSICALCHDNATLFLDEYYKTNPNIQAWIIEQKPSEHMRNRYGEFNNVRLLGDKKMSWSRYGLLQARHFFFLVQAGRIVYWSDFTNDDIKKIKKEIKHIL